MIGMSQQQLAFDIHRSVAFDSIAAFRVLGDFFAALKGELGVARAVENGMPLKTGKYVADIHIEPDAAETQFTYKSTHANPEGFSCWKSHVDELSDINKRRQTKGKPAIPLTTFEKHLLMSPDLQVAIEMLKDYTRNLHNPTLTPNQISAVSENGAQYRRFLCFKLLSGTPLVDPYQLHQDNEPAGHCTLFSLTDVDVDGAKPPLTTRPADVKLHPCVAALHNWMPCGILLKAAAEPNWKLRFDGGEHEVDEHIETVIDALYYLNENTPWSEEMDMSDEMITSVVQTCTAREDLLRLSESQREFLMRAVDFYQRRKLVCEEEQDNFASRISEICIALQSLGCSGTEVSKSGVCGPTAVNEKETRFSIKIKIASLEGIVEGQRGVQARKAVRDQLVCYCKKQGWAVDAREPLIMQACGDEERVRAVLFCARSYLFAWIDQLKPFRLKEGKDLSVTWVISREVGSGVF